MSIKSLLRGSQRTLRFIASHPMNVDHRTAAILRFFRWQVRSRLGAGPFIVPYVNTTELVVRRGMAGATGNVYCGLHEFEDMALTLHALRPDDLFVDVGANVGSYSLLAATAGADVVAFEPIKATFEDLAANVRHNSFDDLIELVNEGVGSEPGELTFTTDRDTVNRVVADSVQHPATAVVPVTTLDLALDGTDVTLLKIDVEGFEEQVLDGAAAVLDSPSLMAVIIETIFDDETTSSRMMDIGFRRFRYEPRQRSLMPDDGTQARKQIENTLFVKSPDRLEARLASAPQFRVLNQHI